MNTAVVNYNKDIEKIVEQRIADVKVNYENKILELQNNYEHKINKIKLKAIHFENKYIAAKEELAMLIFKRYMRSAEQLPLDNQHLLFTCEEEPELILEKEEDETTEVKSYKRKKAGRKPIDPNIPRIRLPIDLKDEEKVCACGCELAKIGEEVTERLVIIPEIVKVLQLARFKYACRKCEGTEDEDKPTVRTAPLPPTMIPGSITTPSLLSIFLTHKFEDHLPYYRQEKMFERIGVSISRQDMANWQQHVFRILNPLFDLLKENVRAGPVIQMDETTVQVVREENRKSTQKSYIWLARGGPKDKETLWYEYQPTRAAYHAKNFLEGYSGYLQTDGYEGYDCAIRELPGIKHVGCFAHARRKFFEASKATKKPQSAEEGIKRIRKLYIIENELRSKNLSDEEFIKERKEKAKPILEEFKEWLLKRADEIPPTNLMGKAIGYTLNQWDKLIAYLESPFLTPDNNACENGIRPFAVGRKNWLFCQSPKGADSSCGIYTLIQTAKHNGKNPYYYLMALFEKAPIAKTQKDWESLLPWNIDIDSILAESIYLNFTA